MLAQIALGSALHWKGSFVWDLLPPKLRFCLGGSNGGPTRFVKWAQVTSEWEERIFYAFLDPAWHLISVILGIAPPVLNGMGSQLFDDCGIFVSST
ncbi:hypothetical protein U1Q18_043055 [Sarracenia purpurea var. burkii]